MHHYLTTAIGRMHVDVVGSGPAIILWARTPKARDECSTRASVLRERYTVLIVDQTRPRVDQPPVAYGRADHVRASNDILRSLDLRAANDIAGMPRRRRSTLPA